MVVEDGDILLNHEHGSRWWLEEKDFFFFLGGVFWSQEGEVLQRALGGRVIRELRDFLLQVVV